MFISENISAWNTLQNTFKKRVFVYLQIQMKFAISGKAVNTDQSTY